jgi:hypothetical protein
MCRFWPAPRTPPLEPFSLIPTRSSSAVEPISVLEKIDRVEVSGFIKRRGAVYYVLDVYLKQHTNRIPTNRRLSTDKRERPDYQIQRRYSEFENLRYNVWLYAQRRHDGGKSCKYCDNYMDFIVYSFAQPRVLVKLFGRGKRLRQRIFQKFSNSFTALAIGGKTEPRLRYLTCEGYLTIPSLVERFLREDV